MVTHNIKRVTAFLMAIGVMVSATGCHKKADPNADPLLSEKPEVLVSMIHDKEMEIADLKDDLSYAEEKLTAVQSESKQTAGIRKLNDGTGRMTFFTVDGVLDLQSDFIYPGSTEMSSSSQVLVTSSVSFSPTSNWVIKLYGSKADLAHTSNIYGQISAGNISSTVSYGDLEVYLNSYLEGIPVSTKTSSSLFLNGNICGIDSIITTFIDDEPATMRFGLAALKTTSLHYCFYYMGEPNVIYDEAILSLIRTIVVYNNPLAISA